MPTFKALCPLAVCLAVASGMSHAADAFVPAGAKATLGVDYLYESTGRKSNNGGYDPYEWKVKRTLSMVAELAAQPPTAMPTVQPIDAAQIAQLTGMVGKVQAVHTRMAPTMADVTKLIAKCGEDEACMTREAQKLGAAMQGTPQMAAALGVKKDIEALSWQDGPRYQAWRPTAQRGTYFIDEHVQISNTDPICTSKPRHRCTREETRKGGGDVPVPAEANAKGNQGAAAGISAVEVDAGKNTLTLALPVPLAMLPYTETIKSDEPDGTYDTPIARGARQKQAFFRVGVGGIDKPLTVALKGGWRSQEGEQKVQLKGNYGDAGTLTVRWRFKVL